MHWKPPSTWNESSAGNIDRTHQGGGCFFVPILSARDLRALKRAQTNERPEIVLGRANDDLTSSTTSLPLRTFSPFVFKWLRDNALHLVSEHPHPPNNNNKHKHFWLWRNQALIVRLLLFVFLSPVLSTDGLGVDRLACSLFAPQRFLAPSNFGYMHTLLQCACSFDDAHFWPSSSHLDSKSPHFETG